MERESLAGELLGALGPSRPGVHLEVTTDDGRHLAVFRPTPAAPASSTSIGPPTSPRRHRRRRRPLRPARHRPRAGPADAQGHRARPAHDQAPADASSSAWPTWTRPPLWAAAARVRVTDEALQAESTAAGTAPEDAEIIDRIEQRHYSSRRPSTAGPVRRRAALLAGSVAWRHPAGHGVPPGGWPCPRRGRRRDPRRHVPVPRPGWSGPVGPSGGARSAAGAQSYLAFQVRRVDGLVSEREGPAAPAGRGRGPPQGRRRGWIEWPAT